MLMLISILSWFDQQKCRELRGDLLLMSQAIMYHRMLIAIAYACTRHDCDAWQSLLHTNHQNCGSARDPGSAAGCKHDFALQSLMAKNPSHTACIRKMRSHDGLMMP